MQLVIVTLVVLSHLSLGAVIEGYRPHSQIPSVESPSPSPSLVHTRVKIPAPSIRAGQNHLVKRTEARRAKPEGFDLWPPYLKDLHDRAEQRWDKLIRENPIHAADLDRIRQGLGETHEAIRSLNVEQGEALAEAGGDAKNVPFDLFAEITNMRLGHVARLSDLHNRLKRNPLNRHRESIENILREQVIGATGLPTKPHVPLLEEISIPGPLPYV
jgi:hypothetical protein